jgi:ATP-binding cassette, subfamily F, member 3
MANANRTGKILLQKPDLILLDEPTNHLDIESIQWLEEFLINSAKAVIVISHDRAFVDNITSRTIEVTMGRIYDYKANYSSYLQLRKERRVHQQKAFDEQQKMIAETQEFIERFKGTYSKTLQVQSRVKMLEKLELVEVDEKIHQHCDLSFHHHHDQAVILLLSMSYRKAMVIMLFSKCRTYH